MDFETEGREGTALLLPPPPPPTPVTATITTTITTTAEYPRLPGSQSGSTGPSFGA